MNEAFDLVRTAFEATPLYWIGVGTWAVGFALYVGALLGRDTNRAGDFGSTLCWLGFGLTALAHTGLADVFGGTLTWPAIDLRFLQSTTGLIWLLWIAGALALIASWLRIASARVGWLGLCIGMTGVLASWFTHEETRKLVMASGVAVVTLLTYWLHRRRELGWVGNPGDYEAELIRLCGGSKRKARRLIRDELKRSRRLTRAGAALAVVTRLRHARDPYKPTL